ncbi:MAG: PilN domain-containing protein [Nitrospirota bacterium]
MIKVNLLPVKRKRKPKPLPTFVPTLLIATIITIIVMVYLVIFFNHRLSTKKEQLLANEKKIEELKEKIKAVENFERLNNSIQQKNEIIEQLRKNQSIPVKILDGISGLLPKGVWLSAMAFSGDNINIDGYAFTNSEIVSYVDNIKNSQMFTEVYLQESKSTTIENVPLYMFKLTFKLKV